MVHDSGSREPSNYQICHKPLSEDDKVELDSDIVQWLRKFGARFIRDLGRYYHCECFVPALTRAHFDKCQRNFPRSFSRNAYELPPSKDDFKVDAYGDFGLQDFFVERDERESAFGVIHFSQKFVNVEYDAVLREYSILNFSSKPGSTLTHRGDKEAFKQMLKNFISAHSSSEPLCPPVSIESPLFVLAFHGKRVESKSEPFTEERKSFLQDIVDKLQAGTPVEFPCILQYSRNWLVPTIAEQSAAYLDFAETPTKLTRLDDIVQLEASEIFVENIQGHEVVPEVILRKRIQRRTSSDFERVNSTHDLLDLS